MSIHIASGTRGIAIHLIVEASGTRGNMHC